MSEFENNEAVEQQCKNEPTRLLNILSLMEFYLSDENLSKDQYLKDLVSSCPFVPLQVFLKCNKFRSMPLNVSDIQKAVKKSSVLELSEDGQRIRKKDSMVTYDVDIRTVYVESIPVTASRISLTVIFSYFGRVQYISLPTFKNSPRIKGFGFVEYSRPQEAQNCINGFTLIGRKLPSNMPPEELSSIKMYNKAQDTPTENKTIYKESKDETRQEQIKDEDKIPKNEFKKKSNDKLTKFIKKDALHGLKILSKTEWKVLQNKHLQKKNMEELKPRVQEKRQYTKLPGLEALSVEIDNCELF